MLKMLKSRMFNIHILQLLLHATNMLIKLALTFNNADQTKLYLPPHVILSRNCVNTSYFGFNNLPIETKYANSIFLLAFLDL